MSKQELTPWFVNGEKPWLPGPYEVDVGNARHLNWYSYWNGDEWKRICTEIHTAIERRHTSTEAKVIRWRGLAHPPKAIP